MDQDLALLVLVVDRSGSMAAIRGAMEEGISQLLAGQVELAQEGKRGWVSLYQFDHVCETVTELKPAGELGPCSLIPRGRTALFDSAAYAIDRTGQLLAELEERSRPGRVVVVMVTDGLENASRHVTREALMARISHQREVYGWEFVFLGANQDAIAVGQGMGVDARYSLKFDAEIGAVRRTFERVKEQAKILMGPRTLSHGFSDEDRKAARAEVAGNRKDRSGRRQLGGAS